MACLEEIRLLHDAQELLLVDLAVAVAIGLVDHLLELLVRHPLTELLRHSFQVLERNLARLVVIEEPESLQDLVFRIAIQDLLRHHRHELRKLDRAGPVIVNILDHLLNLFLLRLETKGTHRNLELLRVDGPGAIRVEKVKRFLDLLLLLLRQLLLLAATASETTTKSHDAVRKSTGPNEHGA